MTTPRQFVGKGWAFPLRFDASGRVALVTDTQAVEESISLILRTAYGERPMRPDFGCAIHDLIYAGSDGATLALIAYEVRLSLRRWEPRITVEDVSVTPSDQSSATLHIDISYTIKSTNDPRNLVFPFYVIPEEG